MNKKPQQKELEKRMKDAYAELAAAANNKTEKDATLIYTKIGLLFGVTGQTVYNYVKGKSKSANGFLIEALTKEFNKLPLSKKQINNG